MGKFDLSTFIRNVEVDLSESDYLTLQKHFFFRTYDGGDRQEADDIDQALRPLLESMHLKMIFALESMRLPSLLSKYVQAFGLLDKDLTRTQLDPEFDLRISPFCELVRKYLLVLGSQSIDSANRYEINLLENILKNSGEFLHDFAIEPKNEADVQRTMFKILNKIFPSALREVVINQVDRNYKADFGIVSLGCLIEYKFVASQSELAKVYGELYEDMKAYSAASEWSRFYGVVYMNAPYTNIDRFEQDRNRVSWPKNWKIVLVIGPGARKAKSGK